jgi:hypothetical protein
VSDREPEEGPAVWGVVGVAGVQTHRHLESSSSAPARPRQARASAAGALVIPGRLRRPRGESGDATDTRKSIDLRPARDYSRVSGNNDGGEWRCTSHRLWYSPLRRGTAKLTLSGQLRVLWLASWALVWASLPTSARFARHARSGRVCRRFVAGSAATAADPAPTVNKGPLPSGWGPLRAYAYLVYRTSGCSATSSFEVVPSQPGPRRVAHSRRTG